LAWSRAIGAAARVQDNTISLICAEIGGDFSLTAGETLQIAVGGAGMSGGWRWEFRGRPR
jgi:hypothetical protein